MDMSPTPRLQHKQQPLSPPLRLVDGISGPLAHEEPPCRAATPPGSAPHAGLASRHRFVPAGAELYCEGDEGGDLYLVVEGWVIQYQILSDGRRQILDFALPGSVLGFVSPSDPVLTHSAESLTGATVAVIPRDRLRELCRSQPDFAVHLISVTAETLNLAFENITDMGRRNARESVAHLLLRLYSRIRAQCPRGTESSVMIPLTQEDIGDALGLTAVHVCRTLRSLRQDGILSLGNGKLDVLDLDGLREVAGAHRASELGDSVPELAGSTRERPVRLVS
jgi:CRP/FNR family transcriptional regulator